MKTMLAALLLSSWLSPDEPPKVRDARAQLEKNPDDAKACLTVALYCVQKEDWAAALPLFLRAKDTPFSDAASKEQKASGNGFDETEAGDAWLVLSQKHKEQKASFRLHAAELYGKAMTGLQDPVWRDKLRDKLRAVLATGPASPKASGSYPQPWAQFSGGTQAGVDMECAHSGTKALKMLPAKDADASSVKTDFIPAQAGQMLKVTAWVLSDGTDGDDDLFTISFVSATGNGLGGGLRGKIVKDRPFWSKIELEGPLPDKTAKINVLIVMKSRKGRIFVDDVSILSDHKEILKNGGFEQ